jgi:arylsulfatase A-like enzyme
MKLAVVLVRNLSAGWLGAYGNEWVATPNLDRLAAEGIVFERHIADRADGQPDSYAGDVKRFDDLVPPWDVPVEVFETYAEEFDGLEPVREPEPIDADDLAAWDALRCSYAAVLTRVDAQFGRFFEDCRREGTAIVFTSDIGFPLGEHGVVGSAGCRPHAERVHLPLILWRPDGVDAGRRVDGITQPERLNAVLARMRVGSNVDDENVFEESIFQAIVISSTSPFAVTRNENGAVVAIRTSDWTCLPPIAIDDSRTLCARLYRFPEDANECNDLADREAEIVAELTVQTRRAYGYSSDAE